MSNGVDVTPKLVDRKCSDCKKRFPPTLEYFYRDTCRRDGLARRCKTCQIARVRKWQDEHVEDLREYQEVNREKISQRQAEYRANLTPTQREANREYMRDYMQKHRKSAKVGETPKRRKTRLTPQQKQTAEFRRLATEIPPGEFYETPYRKWALEPNQKLGRGQVDGWCNHCQRFWPANTYHWRLNRKTGTFGDTCLLCLDAIKAEKRAAKVAAGNG